MYTLIYISSAAEHVDKSQLESILKSSVQNNQKAEISGILLMVDKLFFQVLEGPEDKVLACFERIKKDTRHHDIHILEARETKERYFPDWGMAFQYVAQDKLPPTQDIKAIEDIASFQALFRQPHHIVSKWLRSLKQLLPLTA